ncbi:hypothetical protein Mapa_014164 [Marchantia paleacea]|nr:hypothetical protein Mapa_014164 [Marchantia paleacea]
MMDPYQLRHNTLNSSESSSVSSEDASTSPTMEGSSGHLRDDATQVERNVAVAGGAPRGFQDEQRDVFYSTALNGSSWLGYTPDPPAGRVMDGHWAQTLLSECGKAVCADIKPRVQELMWMLNELSSPYGDYDQRLASYFLQALFCKIAGTGPRCYRILCTAAERSYSFDSMRKMILKFQEASPWTTFGHVASNGAILEAFEGEMKVHIVDISNTFCTQWPTLLESLATRPEGAPHLHLTTIILSMEASALKVMKEIGQRMEKFARLMGVPFEFTVLQQPELGKLDESDLQLDPDEALAINCNHSLHRVPDRSPGSSPFIRSLRDEIISTLRSMNPKIVTVTEEEADLLSTDFSLCYPEALRFYSLFFESLEESFPRASNERLMLERSCARTMVNILACEDMDDCNCKRLEKAAQWGSRFANAGFSACPLSDDVVDDIRALLKRYKDGWGLEVRPSGVFLSWKVQPAICTSVWKPAGSSPAI